MAQRTKRRKAVKNRDKIRVRWATNEATVSARVLLLLLKMEPWPRRTPKESLLWRKLWSTTTWLKMDGFLTISLSSQTLLFSTNIIQSSSLLSVQTAMWWWSSIQIAALAEKWITCVRVITNTWLQALGTRCNLNLQRIFHQSSNTPRS